MNPQDILFAKAKQMDIPLLLECLRAVDPLLDNNAYPHQDAVWTRIKASLPKQAAIARRRLLATVLIAALLLTIIGGAVAYFYRDIFNFTFDAGWGEKGTGTVQKSAYDLLNANLAHLSLEHSDIDILEAVYDGHELRVVYSLWWRDATEHLTYLSNAPEMVDVSRFQADNIAWMCDWIEVNGQSAYFSDIHTVLGDKPGQVLFYLQTNLVDWDIHPTESLTIGLPLILTPRQGRDGQIAQIGTAVEALAFTIPVTRGEGLYYKAAPNEPTVLAYYPLQIESGLFSPVSAILRLLVTDIDEKYDYRDWQTVSPFEAYANTWAEAVLCDMDFVPLGITTIESYGHTNEAFPHSITLTYSLSPPDAWPEQAQLVMRDGEGNLIKDQAVVFDIIPDDSMQK